MKLSVCMAAHNGERYILAQLTSILCQLGSQDEVIVVDDASTDETKIRVRSLKDDRIKLIEHKENLGVLKAFEAAIRHAAGDILFLSDQDDLWAPNKVSTLLRAFQLHPESNLIVSDATLIDENNKSLAGSYYAIRGRFRPGLLANIVRCSYLGCTMAFRRTILDKVLPFPTRTDIYHDLWIGTVNALTGGKTLYLEEPLVLYRRHGANATGTRRLTRAHQMKIRLALCLSLAKFCLRWRRRKSMHDRLEKNWT